MKKREKTSTDWTKTPPFNRYFDFIAANAQRCEIILDVINSLKLNSAAITIQDSRHFFIFPPGQKPLRQSGTFPFCGQDIIILSAHYDRVEGSPGANDNSIAVFHLLKAATILSLGGYDRWIVLFTDKEEIKSGEGIETQGSFLLAEKLKTWGLNKARIFNFDVCGAGDTFILSTTTDRILGKSGLPNICNVRNDILNLRNHALAAADNLRLEKVLLAPTPFSDCIGFLLAGFAAQTITILPAKEAELYENLLRDRPEFADSIISGKVKEPQEYRLLPETWRNLNNASDVPSRLTPQFFDKVIEFMVALCR